MFAILETGSKQYRVEEGDTLEVEKINPADISGEEIVFRSVLLFRDGDRIVIGEPFVDEARVKARLVAAKKAPKIIVFKKKAKKQYRRTRGHRQDLHLIRIEKIELATGAEAKEA